MRTRRRNIFTNFYWRYCMRTKMMLMAVVLTAMMAGMGLQQASARGVGYKGDTPQHTHRLDAASKEKIAKFRSDTKDIRKSITMKRAEESALIHSENPNIEAVKTAAGELFDLQSTLQEKAQAAGLFAAMHQEIKSSRFDEMHQKFLKFSADTKDLRKQIAQEKAAKRALMHNRTPDPLAVSKVAGELFDLKSSLHDKADAAGLPHFHQMACGKKFHHCNFTMMD